MSGTKTLPTLTNLRPPYPTYRARFFTDETGTTLRVNDPNHGFRHDARGFSYVNAWWLAEAAGLVYDNLETIRARFAAAGVPRVEQFDTLDRADTQAFVAENEDLALVVFRGTESDHRVGEEFDFEHIFNDIQTDARFKPSAFGPGGGRVHTGFREALDAVWPALAAHLSALADGQRTFWFTGHSLGGALATLALARGAELPGFAAHGIYTFGSPLVGDADFKRHFDAVLRKFGIEYYRFVNNRDIVPLVPPELILTGVPPRTFRYGHVGTLKFIDGDGRISDGLGVLERVTNLLGSLFKRAAGFFDKSSPPKIKLVPDRLKDHVPMFYATHIWNAHVREKQ